MIRLPFSCGAAPQALPTICGLLFSVHPTAIYERRPTARGPRHSMFKVLASLLVLPALVPTALLSAAKLAYLPQENRIRGVIDEPTAVTPRRLSEWERLGVNAVAVVLDESHDHETYQAAANAAAAAHVHWPRAEPSPPRRTGKSVPSTWAAVDCTGSTPRIRLSLPGRRSRRASSTRGTSP